MTLDQFRYTRHQVPRSALADAETHNRIYLIKNVSVLHATYQIRVLLHKAQQTGKKLVLRVPVRCKLARDLASLKRAHASTLVVEKV